MSRRAREQAGRRAESMAVWLLRLKGYRILAQRVKTKVGEIDVLAQKGQSLIIVEVKQRQTVNLAEDSLGPRDWARISAAAKSHISKSPKLQGLAVRFDVIFLIGRWKLIHHRDFWRAD